MSQTMIFIVLTTTASTAVIDKKGRPLQSLGMHLITMAHYGEAQAVITNFGLSKLRPDVFGNEHFHLLLTGEGPFEAAIKTALEIPKAQYSQVINLGIAGSLTNQFRPGELTEVRSVYLIQDLRPQFKSYEAAMRGVDCLTSFERITDPMSSQHLRGIGTIVDREAWGVAMSAKAAGIPFTSWKVISDMASDAGICEIVREDALNYSEILAQKLNDLLHSKIHDKENLEIPGFHFTVTMRHRFQLLLNKLAIKEDLPQEELLKTLPINSIQELEITPKARALKLIELLEEKIDPFKQSMLIQMEKLQQDFQKQGIKLQYDSQFEDPNVTLSFEAKDNVDLFQKSEALKSLNLSSWEKIMHGELHVE